MREHIAAAAVMVAIVIAGAGNLTREFAVLRDTVEQQGARIARLEARIDAMEKRGGLEPAETAVPPAPFVPSELGVRPAELGARPDKFRVTDKSGAKSELRNLWLNYNWSSAFIQEIDNEWEGIRLRRGEASVTVPWQKLESVRFVDFDTGDYAWDRTDPANPKLDLAKTRPAKITAEIVFVGGRKEQVELEMIGTVHGSLQSPDDLELAAARVAVIEVIR